MKRSLLAASALILFSNTASAATFSAFAGGGVAGSCNTETESIVNSSSPVSVSSSGAGAGCGSDVKARVSQGSVGVFASFASNAFEPGEISPLGSVLASGVLNDRIFILPDTVTFMDKDTVTNADFLAGVDGNGLMDVGLSFGFSGTVNAGTSSIQSFRSKTGFATLEGRINLSATTGGCCGVYDPLNYSRRFEAIGSALPSTTTPSDISIHDPIGVRFQHDPTAGIGVRIQLGATAGVGGFGGSSDRAVGTASSLNSLGYFADGPVLDLPTGFTAYSESGFIVDNRLVGSDVAPVPLPAGLPLLLAGLAGLATFGRRKKAI